MTGSVNGEWRPAHWFIEAVPQRYSDVGKWHYVKPDDITKQELKVFEFCCRHEKKVHLAVDYFDQGRHAAVVKAKKRREEAAKAKALQLFNQCAGMSTKAKLAKLKQLTRGSKVDGQPIRFPSLEDA